MNDQLPVRLTSFSHGAGCGCKISPGVLDRILATGTKHFEDTNLLVGNDTRDDAAVYDLGNGNALISTTDFFMPIVDDAYDFGRIASANAISDVYAMGGRPVLAIAILGWPINILSPELAARVLEGSRTICAEAGIALAGGHSIDTAEPIFGLAVNGLVNLKNIRRNSTARPGCLLYLTKKLGVGIFSTAQKKGLLSDEDAGTALKSMVMLNKLGEKAAELDFVAAMTDVTGFGLAGHLLEMCESSGLTAEIDFSRVPVMAGLETYLAWECIPGGTMRNLASYASKVEGLNEQSRYILADPQTSGGLLIAVDENAAPEFESFLQMNGVENYRPFGRLVPGTSGPVIRVR